jgi:hypothetical protein
MWQIYTNPGLRRMPSHSAPLRVNYCGRYRSRIMDTSCALEKQFPRIMQSIILMWGFPEFSKYIEKISVDDRGNRQGFPAEVLEEIMLLQAVHLIKQGTPLHDKNDTIYTR